MYVYVYVCVCVMEGRERVDCMFMMNEMRCSGACGEEGVGVWFGDSGGAVCEVAGGR